MKSSIFLLNGRSQWTAMQSCSVGDTCRWLNQTQVWNKLIKQHLSAFKALGAICTHNDVMPPCGLCACLLDHFPASSFKCWLAFVIATWHILTCLQPDAFKYKALKNLANMCLHPIVMKQVHTIHLRLVFASELMLLEGRYDLRHHNVMSVKLHTNSYLPAC